MGVICEKRDNRLQLSRDEKAFKVSHFYTKNTFLRGGH